ncbi:Prefoldin subunit-domain-containing protein [Aspergillus varians]
MGVPDNNFEGLERQRLELESNILQLQQSLYHWREWEAEYEGLKEDISDLDDNATADDFLRTSRNFDGRLVTEAEFQVIIGEKQGVKRTRTQVIDLISRRIDYVKNNVSSMEKTLRAAETQLEALDSVERRPQEPTRDFPMKEIIEELDEDGEVISSKTTTPGDQASSLLDILKKAGVKDIPDLPKPDASAPTESSSSEPTLEDHSSSKAEGEQNQDDHPAAELRPVSSASNEDSVAPVSDVAKTAAEAEIPVVHVDESPEDAQLRREMLRYGLDEVGAVVAELEFDEDASDISIEDGYDSNTYEDEEEGEEDQYGRSVQPVLDEDYHLQMRELEAKLNARGMWNVGKDSTSLPMDVKEDLNQVGKVKIDKTPGSNGEPAPKAKPKKKVAFADDLDIAPAAIPPAPKIKKAAPREIDLPVVSDSIVERTQQVEKESATIEAPVPKKASRFKTSRGTTGTIADVNSTAFSRGVLQSSKPSSQRKGAPVSSTPTMPLFPAKPAEPKPFSQPISDITEKPPSPAKNKGKILADTLVERAIDEGTAAAPEPDELDEELHRKEIATEFYRMRNRMAKQNGDSLDEEQEMVAVETKEAPRRISKFRAARMG